ncbi:glycosyltransferase [Psychroflexus tropicus]|uniref:glycosyltransferase n=1 Tax=Psychroflexus tropicus TaxID=197345 RepID=UPI0003612437|nr:glycosyltransferase [Psychroflexus tropicus]
MHILIVNNTRIPVKYYGGTERLIWGLGKELVKLGHKVTYLVNKGSSSDFASVIYINYEIAIIDQIPEDIDLVHFHFTPADLKFCKKPYIITIHGNYYNDNEFDKNVVFLSKNHANRYNSDSFVHNGLDWDDYSNPNFTIKRSGFHFLAKASWSVKNLKGAIDIIKKTKTEQLNVLGGRRLSERVLKMGPSYVFSTKVNFKGMVGGLEKENYLNRSKGLIFPVLWHEPFGLALIESLYFGCPVFGTPYGSLKEIINDDVGFLSNKTDELANAILKSEQFSPQTCHEYAYEIFNSKNMTLQYLNRYEKVIQGNTLNKSNPMNKLDQNNEQLTLI